MSTPIRVMRRKHVWLDMVSPDGHPFRVKGDPQMEEETRRALGELMDLMWKDWESKHSGEKEPKPVMATITRLIEEVKLLARGVIGLNHPFEHLEIAGVDYQGKLTLRRTYDHDYAWGCFVRINAGGKSFMLSAYEDDPGVALDLLKNEMFKWAREREAEAQP